jgi:Ca-activated chloride channel family protein
MLVLVAITLVIFIVAVVFSIDVAYMQLVRAQLRAAADAAARAGAQTLASDQDEQAAIAKAIEIAELNLVAGQGLKLSQEDIELGKSVRQPDGSWDFVPGAQPYGAVRVTAHKSDSTKAGAVKLLLGGMLGTQTFEPQQVATASQMDQDIVLVLDRSGSMAWDLSGNDNRYPPGGAELRPPHSTLSRWAAAVAAVNEFIIAIDETAPNEQVAQASFSSDHSRGGFQAIEATIDAPLTLTYSQITSALSTMSSKPIIGATDIGAGIDMGIAALKGPTARKFALKTIIVMTDGHWTSGGNPRDAARRAAAEQITVHAITFSTGADESLMRDVAEIGGGRHYHAPDAAALKEIYRELALTLPVILTQ